MNAREAFLLEHARLHAKTTTGSDDVSFEDVLWVGSAEELRARPRGLNSILWIFWHITRVEDLVVNRVIRARAEILDRFGWRSRLGLQTALIGTDIGDEEAAAFSERLDPDAVRAYRAEVGRETRRWVQRIDPVSLDERPDVRAALIGQEAVGDAQWLIEFWHGRTAHDLLTLPVVGHGHIHVGEARVTHAQLGREGF